MLKDTVPGLQDLPIIQVQLENYILLESVKTDENFKVSIP